MEQKPLVFLMLSGGVDSSASAVKLLEQGYRVVAVFIKNWSVDQLTKLGAKEELYNCFWEEDANDARLVAEKLNIPFYVWDFQEEYRTKVVEYMIEGYKNGITPNPDVMCNSVIKFGIFYQKAMELGADFVATGHYARISMNEFGQTVILKGVDVKKDQTYFIWKIKKEQLQHILFPIGDFETKALLREYAQKHNLINADKKDSQGICFIGKMPLRELLLETIGHKSGEIIDQESGNILGQHEGAHIYTIGQRNGLGLGGGPWFVSKIDIKKNQVFVLHKEKEKALLTSNLESFGANWQVNLESYFGEDFAQGFECNSQIRYHQEDVKCKVRIIEDRVFVEFFEPVKAVAKGQSIVFFYKDVLLGGATII